MRKVIVGSLALVAALCMAAPAFHASAAAFDDGKAERRAWEEWFASLSGDFKKGAEFWAGQRSKAQPGTCYAPDGSSTGDWTQGCLAAQRQLAYPDLRRKAEPEYRRGWRTFTGFASTPAGPSVAQSGSTAAAQTKPPSSSDFNQGLADRQALETWFAALTGDFKKGAEYWAGQRNLRKPGSCNAPDGTSDGDWAEGCLAARNQFGQSDARRKAEPEYRAGWNSYSRATAPPVVASATAPQTPVVPTSAPTAGNQTASPTPVVSAPATSPQTAPVAPAPAPSAGSANTARPAERSDKAASLARSRAVSRQMAALQQELEKARRAKSDADLALKAPQDKLEKADQAKRDAEEAAQRARADLEQAMRDIKEEVTPSEMAIREQHFRDAYRAEKEATQRAAQLSGPVSQAEREVQPLQAAAASAAARVQALERRQEILVTIGAECLEPREAGEVHQCKRAYLEANFGTEQDLAADLGPTVWRHYNNLLAEEDRAQEQAQRQALQAELRAQRDRERAKTEAQPKDLHEPSPPPAVGLAPARSPQTPPVASTPAPPAGNPTASPPVVSAPAPVTSSPQQTSAATVANSAPPTLQAHVTDTPVGQVTDTNNPPEHSVDKCAEPNPSALTQLKCAIRTLLRRVSRLTAH